MLILHTIRFILPHSAAPGYAKANLKNVCAKANLKNSLTFFAQTDIIFIIMYIS